MSEHVVSTVVASTAAAAAATETAQAGRCLQCKQYFIYLRHVERACVCVLLLNGMHACLCSGLELAVLVEGRK